MNAYPGNAGRACSIRPIRISGISGALGTVYRLNRAVVMADGRLIDAPDLELVPAQDQVPDFDLRAARLRSTSYGAVCLRLVVARNRLRALAASLP